MNSAGRVLGGGRHLVEILRLEGDEQPLLAERIGGGRLGVGQHVDRDAAGIHLLLEAAQDRRAAGAEHLDLDAVLLLERLGDLLSLLDRRRGVPDQLAFGFGLLDVDGILRVRGAEEGGERQSGGDERCLSFGRSWTLP